MLFPAKSDQQNFQTKQGSCHWHIIDSRQASACTTGNQDPDLTLV